MVFCSPQGNLEITNNKIWSTNKILVSRYAIPGLARADGRGERTTVNDFSGGLDERCNGTREKQDLWSVIRSLAKFYTKVRGSKAERGHNQDWWLL